MAKKSSIKRLSRALKRFGSIRKYKILTNLVVQYEEETASIDAALVGNFGVILFDACDYKGELYGSEKDPKWALYEKEYKSPVNNLLLLLNEKNDILRRIFAKEEIYKVNIDSFVVLMAKPKKIKCFFKSDRLLTMKTLNKLPDQEKYDTNKGLDSDRVIAAFEKYRYDG